MAKDIIKAILRTKDRESLAKDLGYSPAELDIELNSKEIQDRISEYCKGKTQETLLLLSQALPRVAERLIALTESTNQKVALEACTRIIYFFKGSSPIVSELTTHSPILDDDTTLIRKIKEIQTTIVREIETREEKSEPLVIDEVKINPMLIGTKTPQFS